LGTVLAQSDLSTVSFTGTVPKGAIVNPASAIGRGVVSDIYQGEPILESRLAAPGSGGGLAATIPDGMRACAVAVNEIIGVAGFVTPGMRVDVLVSGNPPNAPGGREDTLTTTILQNIQVLSAGTDIQKDAEGKPQQVQVVTLLVTPDQAQTLSLASSQLKIQLVLRNPLDTKVAPVASTPLATLFGKTAAPAPQKAVVKTAPKPVVHPYSMTIINGSKTTQESFGSPEGQH
jgi:pilus assembly protein CpaB